MIFLDANQWLHATMAVGMIGSSRPQTASKFHPRQSHRNTHLLKFLVFFSPFGKVKSKNNPLHYFQIHITKGLLYSSTLLNFFHAVYQLHASQPTPTNNFNCYHWVLYRPMSPKFVTWRMAKFPAAATPVIL